MKYYFKLQYRLFVRQLTEWGFSIVVALFVLLVFIMLLWFAARQFPNYANYALLYFGFSSLRLLNISERTDFLKILFPNRFQVFAIRWIENSLLLSPILGVAVVSGLWLSFWLLLFGLLVFSCGLRNIHRSSSLSTPFRKYPFEFIILFRRLWVIYFLLYGIGLIALYVHNFNMLAVLTVISCLLSLQAYELLEPRDLLWNYTMSARAFLWHKLRRAYWQLALLISPFLLALLGMQTADFLLILGAYLFVCLLLSLLIIVKYAVYPRATGLGEGVLVGCTAVFPLLLLGVLPYYYRKALRNLKTEIL